MTFKLAAYGYVRRFDYSHFIVLKFHFSFLTLVFPNKYRPSNKIVFKANLMIQTT